MKHSILTLTLVAGMGITLTACQQPASTEKPNPLLAHEDEITEIISGMSLEEIDMDELDKLLDETGKELGMQREISLPLFWHGELAWIW